MPDLPDETLMAYADGELAADARKAVEACLAENPDLARRLEVFIATREPLGRLFARPMSEPVPERLLAIVRGREPTDRIALHGRTPSLRLRLADVIANVLLPSSPTAALARYGAAMALGIGVGWMLVEQAAPPTAHVPLATLDQRGIVAEGVMQTALETKPSSKDMQGETGFPSLRTVFSFRNRDGRYCRQYELAYGANDGFAGVACRDEDGTWRIEVHAAAETKRDTSNTIAPAAGAANPIVDAAVDRMIEADVLDASKEGLLIRNGWRARD